MRFGPVPPLVEAEGAVLAHSVAVPGGRLRKGKTITADDVAAMTGAGLDEVTVARLEPGDVGEDAAATRLAAALLGGDRPETTGLSATAATTGRVNLTSQVKGIVDLSPPEAIHAINAIDPMITIATVPPQWQRMGGPGGMVATIKVIAYAVPEKALARACQAARGGAMRMRVAVHRSATLIQTTVGKEDGEKKGPQGDRKTAGGAGGAAGSETAGRP